MVQVHLNVVILLLVSFARLAVTGHGSGCDTIGNTMLPKLHVPPCTYNINTNGCHIQSIWETGT